MKSFFRRPAVIVAELLAITLACALGAALPQAGTAPAAEVAGLRTHGPLITALVDGLALDHIFTSLGFLLLLGLATISLSIVVWEQLRRLRAQWILPLTEAHFRTAPFRREFTRPAATGASSRIRTRGRLGLAGSPLFHIGLLAVIVAGSLGALFGGSAVVDLYEGEVLPATVEAWGAQWPGRLGSPFRLDEPLRLVSVEGSNYARGDLRDLRLRLAAPGPGAERTISLAINEDLPLRRGRLFADAHFGPAALLAWEAQSSAPVQQALLLEQKEPRAYGAYAHGPGRIRARLRAPMPADDRRAGVVEVRILDGAATVAEGTLAPGEALALPGGGSLKLHGLPYWARLRGTYDPGLGLAYFGFMLALLGGALTYGVVRVDELVSVTPEAAGERVVVALRPHRFAPLYRERFERLVRDHGGEI
jgi:hypothetical protein